jgi:hypothetical protein
LARSVLGYASAAWGSVAVTDSNTPTVVVVVTAVVVVISASVRNSPVDRATVNEMAKGTRFDSRRQDIFLFHDVFNGGWGHPVSLTVDVRGSSPGVKEAGG